MNNYRHGDVGMVPVEKIPTGAKRLDPKVCKCKELLPCAMHLALAHGEVTGHKHQLRHKTDEVEIYEHEGNLFIKPTKKAGKLIIDQTTPHQGDTDLHATIEMDTQPKMVVFPQEYDWATEEVNRARD